MSEEGNGDVVWAISDAYIESVFAKMKARIEQDTSVFFDWSRPVLSEVTPNVERSLGKKFKGCSDGYSVAKISGLYTFWIAKLKPGFSIIQDRLYLNEYLALAVGFSIVRERLGIQIRLSDNELLNIFDTLRYHTSSPHALMHLYELWIERAKIHSAPAH